MPTEQSLILTEHTANVDVATRLDQFIPLPARPEFRLKYILQRGNVLCFIRSKPAHFWRSNHISQLKNRYLNVMENGFLIYYEDNENGLCIDLRQAKNVICNADRSVKKSEKKSDLRCHVKIRLPRGNVHIFLREEDVHKWTCAIMKASSVEIPENVNLVSAIEKTENSEKTEDSSASSENSDEDSEDSSDSNGRSKPATYSSSEEDDEIDEKIRELKAEVEKIMAKNPNSPSVRVYREEVEKDLILKAKEQVSEEQKQVDHRKETSFTSEVYCSIPNEAVISLKTTDEKIVEKEEKTKDKKNWWARSLRC